MKEKFIVLLSVMVFITRIQKAVTQCSSPPIPVLTSQNGAAISIRCPINGVYDEIKWKKNGKFLNTSPTKYSTTPADPLALTVMNVDTSDAGTYGCMTNGYDCLAATLQVHLDSTVVSTIMVIVPPPTSSLYYGSPSFNTLSCSSCLSASSFPSPSSFPTGSSSSISQDGLSIVTPVVVILTFSLLVVAVSVIAAVLLYKKRKPQAPMQPDLSVVTNCVVADGNDEHTPASSIIISTTKDNNKDQSVCSDFKTAVVSNKTDCNNSDSTQEDNDETKSIIFEQWTVRISVIEETEEIALKGIHDERDV